jgi:nucleoid-associated protein YgaU
LARKQHVNRENKLAIIIGFSLVLVVAVLISDHFSRARTAEISADITPGKAEDFGVGTAGLTQPIGAGDTIPAHTGPLGEVTDSRTRTVSNEGTAGPDEIAMGGLARDTEPTEVSEDIAIDDPAGRGSNTSPFPPKPVSKGMLKTHEVKDGDKLFRIAAQHYGDGTLWKELAAYNKDRVPNPGVLRVGVTLRIPPKDVLLGEAGRAAPAREGTGGRPAASPKEKPAPVERGIARNEKPVKPSGKTPTATYKVARGDSLGTIAQKLLGTSRRASELFQLNKDVLEDEHSLVAGTVIKIPAR